MSNKAYDVFKWIALVGLPAISALYAALGDIWGFPCVVQVVATFTAVDTFLGVILGISNIQYKKNNN